MRATLICALMLSCMWTPSHAAVNFLGQDDIVLAISPSEPDARTPVSVTLDSSSCLPVLLYPVRRNGFEIEVRVDVADYCDPALPPRFLSEPIGMLPPGNYVVHYLACGGNTLPPGSCFEDSFETFVVTSAARQSIPALGAAGMVLTTLLLLVATRLSRRR